MKIGTTQEKIEIIEKIVSDKKVHTIEDEYYQTMWPLKCKDCGGSIMLVYEQPFFNTYHSQTFKIKCSSCGKTVKKITIPGRI